ncbi:MAG: exo-alpha-sialidase, partial [Clostridia bacterium]|nr:exo-alpha-sialidase [Clostridia bacterium]
KGRIFVSFYSGGETEQLGNYSLLVVSDDGGKTFSEPIAVADMGAEARAYDSCLWIDPLGRLWFIWSVMPDNRVEFVRCDDPEAETLAWSEVRALGYDVMLNKPTVTSTGDWLFPCAVWKDGLLSCDLGADGNPTGAHAFCSRDCGESFELIGTAIAKDRGFDEHMFLEKQDGSIECYIRTRYGIAVSESRDCGKTWSQGVDCGFGGPNSRFYIGRLKSGSILLVNHYRFQHRNNLTAMISEDDGKTFGGYLLLDERSDVSYPDVVEGNDGFLYIVYDRERGAKYDPKRDYTNSAREILMARITEDDVKAGRLLSSESCLKMTVSQLKIG